MGCISTHLAMLLNCQLMRKKDAAGGAIKKSDARQKQMCARHHQDCSAECRRDNNEKVKVFRYDARADEAADCGQNGA